MRANAHPAWGMIARKRAPTGVVPVDNLEIRERFETVLMLWYLRKMRASISRLLLMLLTVLWLGLFVQTCALAGVPAEHAGDCCCEEGADRCNWDYTPLSDDPCPAMQALSSERHPPGLITGDSPLPPAGLFPDRVEYPPGAQRGPSPRLGSADSPLSHPALRFRVLLI